MNGRGRVITALVVAAAIGFAMGLGAPPVPPPWYEVARASSSIVLVFWAARTIAGGVTPAALSSIVFLAWTLTTTAAFDRLTVGLIFATATALALLVLGQARGREPGSFRSGLLMLAVGSVALSLLSFSDPSVGLDGNPRYFAGGKNALTLVLLPMALVLQMLWRPGTRPWRLSKWAVLAGSGVVVVQGGSATGIVASIAVAAWFLTGGRFGRRWWPWFLSVPALHWAVVSGWLISSASWLGELLTDGLGKSPDFTRRSFTWDVAQARIQTHPLGEGRGYSFLSERFGDVAESHNLFLEAMVTGGWPSAGFLLILIGVVMRSASLGGNQAGVFFVWVACLVGTMESYTFHLGFWLLLGVAAASPATRMRPSAVDSLTRERAML